MTLSSGTRLGPYEIIAPIGAGGMGEVYRAKDTKLNRDVAIKVLPESFAADADRVARFTREAKTLASLNHPNIAAIYGIEEIRSGVSSQLTPDFISTALVMELVEGEDLSAIIARDAGSEDPAYVRDFVIPVAKQIADALEAAHEQGIVHRDLKPQNIKVRVDGTVKVLDFGLAKAMDPAGASSDAAMNSPTITARATQMGMIIGTAAYMAPEQARGRAVDRRADIWAFGVVLYEMLTGQRAFAGDDISVTLANVIKEEVAWNALPHDLPAAVQMLLRRCLEKDSRKRLRDIGEARVILDDPGALQAAPIATSPRVSGARAAIWLLASVVVAAATGVIVWRLTVRDAAAPSPTQRFVVAIPPSAALTPAFTSSHIALSSNGQTLVFMGGGAGEPKLYRRDLGQLEAVPIAGTEGARDPFLSPDGSRVGYFLGVDGPLKVVPISGGSPLTAVEQKGMGTGTWVDDATIVFGAGRDGLLRVSAAGGKTEVLTKPEASQWYGIPSALPGGHALLFIATLSGAPSKVGVYSFATGRSQFLIDGDRARYSAGHIVFSRGSAIWAVEFDLARLAVNGDAIKIAEGVSTLGAETIAEFDATPGGSLAYVPAGLAGGGGSMVAVVDRHGARQTPIKDIRSFQTVEASPDGKTLAFGVRGDDGMVQLWTADTNRGGLTQLTFDAGYNGTPIWSPSGKELTFSRTTDGNAGVKLTNDVVSIPVDGSQRARTLFVRNGRQYPSSWSKDGTRLAFDDWPDGGNRDLWVWTQGTAAPASFLATTAHEQGAQFSPDSGRWLAYESNESSQSQVYIAPYPGPGARRMVSSGGGTAPRWSRDGRELFYWAQSRLLRVPVGATSSLDLGEPSVVIDLPDARTRVGTSDARNRMRSWDVLPDGRFVILVTPEQGGQETAVHLVLNWFEERRGKK